MTEENENQPRPLETQSAPAEPRESASPDQPRRRPRRRDPRRRYYDRGNRSDNFGGSNNDSNSSSTVIDPATGDMTGDALDRQSAGETVEGEDTQREPEFGEGIIEISGKGFGFLREPHRKLCK